MKKMLVISIQKKTDDPKILLTPTVEQGARLQMIIGSFVYASDNLLMWCISEVRA